MVDKDVTQYTTALLRTWKDNHEAMISEVRLKGFSSSLVLLQAGAREHEIAQRLIAFLSDRRMLWASFDAESPDRVRVSLDIMRAQVSQLRAALGMQSPLDEMLHALLRVMHAFYDRSERFDLTNLRSSQDNPEWVEFAAALAELRKVFGLQLGAIARTYSLRVPEELASSIPSAAG